MLALLCGLSERSADMTWAQSWLFAVEASMLVCRRAYHKCAVQANLTHAEEDDLPMMACIDF